MEETFEVSTIVVDAGWEAISVPIMVNNPNVDCHMKFVSKSKEPGKGVCSECGGGIRGWVG